MSVIATMPQPVKANRGLLLHLRSSVNLTDNQLFELCVANREPRIERTAEGNLSSCHLQAGKRVGGTQINFALVNWARQDDMASFSTPLAGSFYPTVRCAHPTWLG